MEIRLNIFDEKNKWVGQEYLTEKGKWIHRWVHNGKLEKGGWRGRATGSNELEWKYKVVEDELPNEASGLHLHDVIKSSADVAELKKIALKQGIDCINKDFL